jgi:hypothetical protein
MHFGAWLPVWAWADDAAWQRLIDWINENCHNKGGRLIVTPKLANQLKNPEGLRKIAHGVARQDASGAGTGSKWTPGASPIIVVWPEERTVQRCVRMVAGLPEQSIILLEQAVTDDAPSFQGWASAVRAFNAGDDDHEPPNPNLTENLGDILTNYENELTGAPGAGTYGSSEVLLREKLQAVHADHYDADFVITYAIALGYQGDLKRLRQHYAAAGK